jgi:hypothetical protein
MKPPHAHGSGFYKRFREILSTPRAGVFNVYKIVVQPRAKSNKRDRVKDAHGLSYRPSDLDLIMYR